jgi:hypothetical protein
MSFQAKPKQKNIYPEMLANFEEKRRKGWLKAKLTGQAGMKPNASFKGLNSRRLQMFSGKRGK